MDIDMVNYPNHSRFLMRMYAKAEEEKQLRINRDMFGEDGDGSPY